MDERRREGRPGKTTSLDVVSGPSSAKTAELIGTSRSKVEKLRTIDDAAKTEPEVKRSWYDDVGRCDCCTRPHVIYMGVCLWCAALDAEVRNWNTLARRKVRLLPTSFAMAKRLMCIIIRV